MDKILFSAIFLVMPLCIHGDSYMYHSRVKREASKCYQCNSVYVTSNDQCTDIQQCPIGDYGGCQTEVRTDGGGIMRITKKCKNLDVCRSEEEQFEAYCTGHDVPQSICYYCCEDDLCNDDLSGEAPTIRVYSVWITFAFIFFKNYSND